MATESKKDKAEHAARIAIMSHPAVWDYATWRPTDRHAKAFVDSLNAAKGRGVAPEVIKEAEKLVPKSFRLSGASKSPLNTRAGAAIKAALDRAPAAVSSSATPPASPAPSASASTGHARGTGEGTVDYIKRLRSLAKSEAGGGLGKRIYSGIKAFPKMLAKRAVPAFLRGSAIGAATDLAIHGVSDVIAGAANTIEKSKEADTGPSWAARLSLPFTPYANRGEGIDPYDYLHALTGSVKSFSLGELFMDAERKPLESYPSAAAEEAIALDESNVALARLKSPVAQMYRKVSALNSVGASTNVNDLRVALDQARTYIGEERARVNAEFDSPEATAARQRVYDKHIAPDNPGVALMTANLSAAARAKALDKSLVPLVAELADKAKSASGFGEYLTEEFNRDVARSIRKNESPAAIRLAESVESGTYRPNPDAVDGFDKVYNDDYGRLITNPTNAVNYFKSIMLRGDE